jgi:hypothetical protein
LSKTIEPFSTKKVLRYSNSSKLGVWDSLECNGMENVTKEPTVAAQRCSSVVENLPNMCEDLVLSSAPQKKGKE